MISIGGSNSGILDLSAEPGRKWWSTSQLEYFLDYLCREKISKRIWQSIPLDRL